MSLLEITKEVRKIALETGKPVELVLFTIMFINTKILPWEE